MKVRGISILTRKQIVTRRFGAEAWRDLYRDVAGAHRCFRSFVTADTLVPLPAFLAFHDELMRRFFKDDEASHMEIGREASRWALAKGPFKSFLDKRDLAGFVTAIPKFHKLYFEETTTHSEAALVDGGVEFKVFDLPQWHPYFEHLVVGYIAEALEMFCANPVGAERLRGGAGKSYHYLFHGSPTGAARRRAHAVGRGRPPPVLEPTRHLSNREIEVLLQVAHGKTNEEIGDSLGISRKTAQHHLAHVYRKIGVSGRVGAAVWLAEHGLLGDG